jgi:5-methylcytosine-specific restriction endonuclease McrA
MLQRLQDRSFPKRLWQQQEGKCPVCGQLIDDEAQWLIRPIVPIKAGGTRSLANLKLLHSYCQHSFFFHERVSRKEQDYVCHADTNWLCFQHQVNTQDIVGNEI